MIPTLPFGRTGHTSTRLLFGAAALGSVTQADADRAMETLIKFGINHIDTAASYGEAEVRIGPWMVQHRNEFFLASKTEKRTYQEAKESIHHSLDRLRTGYLDLIQLHAVIEDQEWETATGPGGALQAAIEARQQGLVRFIGITSHTLRAPGIHLKSLDLFDFDSILLPWNYQLSKNPEYAAQFAAVVEKARSKNVAVQIIKTGQRRPWGEQHHWAATWYEPYNDQASLDLAIHWALSQPGVFINTAGDVNVLPMVLDAASRYVKGPSDEQMEALMKAQAAEPLWA